MLQVLHVARVVCCMLHVMYIACCSVLLQVLHKHEDLHAVKSLQAMAAVSYAPTNAPCVACAAAAACRMPRPTSRGILRAHRMPCLHFA